MFRTQAELEAARRRKAAAKAAAVTKKWRKAFKQAKQEIRAAKRKKQPITVSKKPATIPKKKSFTIPESGERVKLSTANKAPWSHLFKGGKFTGERSSTFVPFNDKSDQPVKKLMNFYKNKLAPHREKLDAQGNLVKMVTAGNRSSQFEAKGHTLGTKRGSMHAVTKFRIGQQPANTTAKRLNSRVRRIKPIADQSKAVKKAWSTRKRKYGKSGRSSRGRRAGKGKK